MRIWNQLVGMIDWFIPAAAKAERSELGLAQNFVFTHLFGPLLSQSISLFLYLSDPHPGVACWTVIICIWLFWTLPFVYKWTGNLQVSALISVELLAFTSLFGAFFYGGVSSPFLPWLIIASCSASSICPNGLSLSSECSLSTFLVLPRLSSVGISPNSFRRSSLRPSAGFRFCQRRSTCPGWRSTTPI